jgi:hypothetical protein
MPFKCSAPHLSWSEYPSGSDALRQSCIMFGGSGFGIHLSRKFPPPRVATRLNTYCRYIPILGTIYYVGKAPVTKACQRLSVYLILRKLMMDGRYNGERTKWGKVYSSDRLDQFLDQQVTYPKSLHLDVTGEWSSCCSCLW